MDEANACRHYIEVKNCHLVCTAVRGHTLTATCWWHERETVTDLADGDGFGYFPDSVSERATRHVQALAALVAEGHRGAIGPALIAIPSDLAASATTMR